MNEKFFLYARKSTDVEDKQVLSIDAQLDELRAFAREQGLDVAEEFVEKQSAKAECNFKFVNVSHALSARWL